MKTKDIVNRVFLIMLILALCIGICVFNDTKRTNDNISFQGREDLSNVDFKNDVYELSPKWDSWNGRLYTPEELSEVEEATTHTQLDYSKVDYVTHRLYLNLEPNTRYGLSYKTSNYAMRMFIDGKEVSNGGIPSDTKEGTIPTIEKKITYFTSESELTELVVHVANFVHVEGGEPPVLTIGKESSIITYERFLNIKQGLVFGILFIAFIYYLSIFILNRNQITSLLFSLLCLLLALASGNAIELYIDDWLLSMRLEYLNYIGASVIFASLVNRLFPIKISNYLTSIYIFFSVIFSLIILLTEPLIFSSFRNIFQAISIVTILTVFLILLFVNKNWTFKKILSFVGISVFSFFIIIDILVKNNISHLSFFANKTFNSAMGMVVFLFCYTMVLAIEQHETNIRVEKLHLALGAAEVKYNALISNQKDEVPEDRLSQFGLSKREKEILLLLIDGKSREEIMKLLYISLGTVNTHCTHIYQKVGCNSVVSLIMKLKKD